MISSLLSGLVDSPILTLFIVIGLGYILGNIKIAGFSFGVSAVLFAGLGLGAMEPRLHLPDVVYVLGLVLFVYTIGLQAGPDFFASFDKQGKRANALVLGLLLFAAALTYGLAYILPVPAVNLAGLFCGSLTNTPALAAAVDALGPLVEQSGSSNPNLLNLPIVGYSIAYPFSILIVLLTFHFLARFWKIDFQGEARQAEAQGQLGQPPIETITLKVLNPALAGQTMAQVVDTLEDQPIVFSRRGRGSEIFLVKSSDILALGDELFTIGTPHSIEHAKLLLGGVSDRELPLEDGGFAYQRIYVSAKRVIGMTVAELQLPETHEAVIARIRRGDIDFVPSPQTPLQRGDVLRIVAKTSQLPQIARYFGDSIKGISEADFLSLSLGIVIGVLFGMLPIPLPGGAHFQLGFAGGPLLVSILLGYLGTTGQIVWTLPPAANLVLRQVGLMLFLAGIGVKAGHSFMSVIQSTQALYLIAGSIILSGTVALSAMLIGYKLLKLPFTAMTGIVAGLQTQPACLSYASDQAGTPLPDRWHTVVYPSAVIAKIVLAQTLVGLLWPLQLLH